MAGPGPRVLLADDHPLMLQGLRKLLEPDCEVVGEAWDGRALVEAAERLQPDLVITDISMPGLDGLEATRHLRAVAARTRVVILSFHTEPSWVQAAFEAGAHAYLPKTSVPEEIETAVREVLQGNFFLSPAVTRAVLAAERDDLSAPPPEARLAEEALTPREQDIVRRVGRGLCNKDIARELGVSVPTVRTHLQRIYAKLRQESRVELALYVAKGEEAREAVV
ncbi:MAG TPA: response regulator transcription factor [Thermoanaerobaculia bacterium]|nr:response regulator transcription factor [Thermoanaerobaculia bacterium]